MLLGQLQFQGLTERELPVLITWAGVLSPERPNLLTTHQTIRMMKFRRSRSSGTYSVNPPQGESGEVPYHVKDEERDGKYTLIDKETMSLPNTPRMSFRESVRKSLRKLKRGKQGRDKKKSKKKSHGVVYEISLSHTANEEDIECKDSKNGEMDNNENTRNSNNNINDKEAELEIKLYDKELKMKGGNESLLSEIVSEVSNDSNKPTEKKSENSFKCFPDVPDPQTLLKSANGTPLLPRGPLGDLLKEKEGLKQDAAVEQVIIHNERNEYKVEHLETGETESKWVQQVSEDEENNDDQSVTSKTIDATSTVDKHKTPAIVIHTRPAGSSAELSLRMDEIVFLHRRLNASWYLGEKRGVMGLIAAAFIKIIVDAEPGNDSVRALATKPYRKRSQGELDLKPGQLLYLTHRVDYHWYLAQAGGAKGLVPAAYIEIISSSADGSLPPIPAYAIMVRDRNSVVTEDPTDEREAEERMSETKKTRKRGRSRQKEERSTRNDILKNISRRKEPVLFV